MFDIANKQISILLKLSVSDLGVSAAVCFALSIFTWIVLQPTVGIDDANITLNYAQNIANGLGYVYYEGGERVEGSTSALWTAVTVLGYLVTDRPEGLFAAMGFVFTTGMVLFTILIARSLLRMAGAKAVYVAPMAAGFYALVPELFGWTVWSLMETGLFCFLTAGLIWAVVRIIEERSLTGTHPNHLGAALAVFAVLMVLTRPEAIILIGGTCLVLVVLGWVLVPRFSHTLLITIGSSLAAFAALTFARLTYFGVLHPNTYYAKVSSDRLSELAAGLHYTKTYLMQPEHIVLFLLAGFGFAMLLAHRRHMRSFTGMMSVAVFVSAALLGTFAVYTLLGGDHFGSHRYYLIFLVLIIPPITVGLYLFNNNLLNYSIAAFVCIFTAYQWIVFTQQKGDYYHEFRLAEQSREIGIRLSDYPGRPSVAVYVAGGIALTYDGTIYDMMGLNWSAMAHSDTGAHNRYGNFSKSLFLEVQPEIVAPGLIPCDNDTWPDNPLFQTMLGNLFQDTAFRERYTLTCHDGLSYFQRKAHAS